MKTPDQAPPKLETILVGVDNVRFRRPVVPGDSLRLETLVTKTRGRMWIYDAVATVDGEKVAEASIMANLKLET
jgi:3-hydroxyacyl-[acyl-carrier-protein] dehydratase